MSVRVRPPVPLTPLQQPFAVEGRPYHFSSQGWFHQRALNESLKITARMTS